MIRRLIAEFRLGTTVRSCTEEFGPTPGARYARELAAYSDAELIAEGDRILADIKAAQRRGTKVTR